MPLELRQTVAEIVYPVYEEMVLQATGMDRNLGASLVYLLWLEVLDQFDVKTAYCEDLRLGGTHDRTQAIDRHLKLVGAKLRIGNFMLRLREFRLKQSREQASSSPTPLAIEPSAPERLSRDNPLPPCPARPSATSESASLSSPSEQSPAWKNQETLTKTETENQAQNLRPKKIDKPEEQFVPKTA